MELLNRFIIFLSVFTSIIGAGYFYIGLKMIPGLGLDEMFSLLAWVLIFVLVISIPISYWISHTVASPRMQSVFSYFSFLSLGFFTILLSIVLFQDFMILVFSFLKIVSPYFANLLEASFLGKLFPLSGMDTFFSSIILLAIASILTAWGMFEAHVRIRTIEVNVPVENLHPDLIGFTIAQISDVHIGSTIQRPFLQHVVKRIQNFRPDVVVITGDLVDGPAHLYSQHLAPLVDLKSKYGTFFITGNHEYYNGVLAWIAEIKKLGIHVLLNENKILSHKNAKLALAGVTDLKAGSILPNHETNAKQAMLGAENSDFKILLAHQPNSIYEAEKAGFDLQLSGHTHGGQYFPGNLIIYLAQKFVAGLHRYKKTLIYVSRGTGYWGPPIRIGAPSEITKIVLVDSKAKNANIVKIKKEKRY